MEYFASRIVWPPVSGIVGLDQNDDIDDGESNNRNRNIDEGSTSQLDNAPNEIEYEK